MSKIPWEGGETKRMGRRSEGTGEMEEKEREGGRKEGREGGRKEGERRKKLGCLRTTSRLTQDHI